MDVKNAELRNKAFPPIIRPQPQVAPRVRREEVMLQLAPGDRKCDNKQDMMMDNIEEIVQDKFIRTTNGLCHNVDDLVRYIISTKGQNIDPLDPAKVAKIWKDDIEKVQILSHPGLDPEILSDYYKLLEELDKEKIAHLRLIADNINILNQIGDTGFLALNDKISSFSKDPEDFLFAQKAVYTLFEKLQAQPNKDLWLNLGVGGINLRQILKTLKDECIHGVGFKLLWIYCNWYNKIITQTDKRPVLQQYMVKIPKSQSYVTFHVKMEDLKELPSLEKAEKDPTAMPLTLVENDISKDKYGRTYITLYGNGADVGRFPNASKEMEDYFKNNQNAKDTHRQFILTLYSMLDELDIGKKKVEQPLEIKEELKEEIKKEKEEYKVGDMVDVFDIIWSVGEIMEIRVQKGITTYIVSLYNENATVYVSYQHLSPLGTKVKLEELKSPNKSNPKNEKMYNKIKGKKGDKCAIM